MASFNITVNGDKKTVEADPQTPLIHILRSLGILSARYGCGLSQCGSCRVFIDEQIEYSCTTSISDVQDAKIQTIEGLGEDSQIDIIQESFLSENAGQCGYCLSGIIISTVNLLKQNPKPDRQSIKSALDDHLCRCGAHNRIIRAIEKAADKLGALDA